MKHEGELEPVGRRKVPWRRLLIGAYVAVGLLLSPLIVFHYELRPVAFKILMIVAWPVELLIWTGIFGRA